MPWGAPAARDLYLVERPDAGQFTYRRTLPDHLAGLVVGEVQLCWTGRTRRLLGGRTIKISFGTGDGATARQRWSVLHPQIEALVQLASVLLRQSAEPHTTADVPRLDPAQVRTMAEQAYHDVLATDDQGQVEPGFVTPVASIILDLVRRQHGNDPDRVRIAELAARKIGDQFQTTSHGATHGHALLFEMNVLFEEYIGRMLVRALAGQPVSVRRQGGRQYCLIELDQFGSDGAHRFRTRPDLILSRHSQAELIIDTKWKRLSPRIDDPKQGISQSDVYQMMAYSRLYSCPRVMLLYPHHDGLSHDDGVANQHRIGGGSELLQIATVRLGQRATLAARLQALTKGAGLLFKDFK